MKDSQSVDEIKKAFDQISLPPIDVTQRVMSKIYSRREKRAMITRKKLIIGILVAMFLISSVGFVAVKTWNLNGPGNIPYKVQIINGSDYIPQEIYQDEFDKLERGKALAVMKVHDNPKNSIIVHLKSTVVRSIDEISSKIGNGFKAPEVLPEGYIFSEADYNCKFDDSYSADLIKESKITSEDYIFKVLEPSNEISNYSLTYKKGETSIFVSVHFNYPSTEIMQMNNGQKAEKININNFEAIYCEHDSTGEITWLENQNGSKTLYAIRSTMLDKDTKANLKMIAESLGGN